MGYRGDHGRSCRRLPGQVSRRHLGGSSRRLPREDAEVSLAWLLPEKILLAKTLRRWAGADEAERVLADAAEHSGQQMAVHSPQLMVARSWLAAAKGLERRAVELALAADVSHTKWDSTPSKPRRCTMPRGSATARLPGDWPHSPNTSGTNGDSSSPATPPRWPLLMAMADGVSAGIRRRRLATFRRRLVGAPYRCTIARSATRKREVGSTRAVFGK